MTSMPELYDFIRTHGIRSGEVVGVVLGILMIGVQVWAAPSVWRKPKHRLTYGDIVWPIVATGVGLFMLVDSWYMVNERYLLRPGAGHYTVGTVVKLNTMRGEPQFACAFVVNGQPCQTGKLCGTVAGRAVPCPALYSRRYVHFAPESPNTAEITDVAVPDSVRHIPPAGWDHIP